MYAVVTSGGKQYRVEAGSELTLERLTDDVGSTITFDRVLLVGDGEDVTVGTPTVPGASVSGTVLGEVLGPKLIVFKFKQKATYRRKNGHRQHLTRVRIDEISAGGKRGTSDRAEESTPKPAKAAQAAKAAEAEKAGSTAATSEPKAEKKPAARKRTAKAAGDEAKPKAAPRKRTAKAKADKAEE